MIEVYHIEDDKAIAHAVKEYLEQHDCRVSVFTTMEEARQAMVRGFPQLCWWTGICRTARGTCCAGGSV